MFELPLIRIFFVAASWNEWNCLILNAWPSFLHNCNGKSSQCCFMFMMNKVKTRFFSPFLDVDECLIEGGTKGHHCQKDQTCVNTIGSYNCTCLMGHFSADNQSCSTTSGQVAGFEITYFLTCSVSVIVCLFIKHLIHRWWWKRRLTLATSASV